MTTLSTNDTALHHVVLLGSRNRKRLTCAVTHKQEYFPKKTQLPLLRKPLDRELEPAVARFRNRTIFFLVKRLSILLGCP